MKFLVQFQIIEVNNCLMQSKLLMITDLETDVVFSREVESKQDIF